MECWYPILVPKYSRDKVSQYLRTLPNGNKVVRNLPGSMTVDVKFTSRRMLVPCGRCPACRRRKQNEWAYRVMEEAKYSRHSFFVTLTLDDDHLSLTSDGLPTLDPRRFHKFTKDLRYRLNYRYYGCGEYGDSFGRPHYHICIFTNDDISFDTLQQYILTVWPDGNIKVEIGVTAGRAKYCCKYSMKRIGFDYQGCVPPFARMSRRPGIGKKFLDHLDFDRFRRSQLWFLHDYQGTPYSLPRYYREAIYSYEERQIHSDLLERTRYSLEDYDLITNFDNNLEVYTKFRVDIIKNRERLFIKQLKRENYLFKYETTKPKFKQRRQNRCDEFISDEF